MVGRYSYKDQTIVRLYSHPPLMQKKLSKAEKLQINYDDAKKMVAADPRIGE